MNSDPKPWLLVLLLAPLGCGSGSKCEETFSCDGQQGAAHAGSGDVQDSGIFGDASSGAQEGDAGPGGGGANGSGGNTGNNGSGGSDGNGGNDGNGGSNGTDGDAGTVVTCANTPGCTPTEHNAVFVDVATPNPGDGSLEAPLTSIVEAFTVAKDTGATDIYVCGGVYDENVVITDDEAGINLHGGFDCDGFVYDAAAVPRIQPSNGGYALHIDALSSAILIEDLAFEASDADDPGESSIAVFVSESSDVTFERCQFTAGNGVAGTSGVTAPFVEGPTPGVNWPVLATLDGHDGTATEGGAMNGPILCPAGDSNSGGQGGSAAPTNGTAGEPEEPGGYGGYVDGGAYCQGGDGERGTDGVDGEGGSASLDSSGFAPGDGEDGTVGGTGAGGGGGAGKSGSNSGGGGGGGAGGCGGNFGPGGQGGGASVAVLIYDASVTLQDSSLISGQAGDGGSGDAGQLRQFSNGPGIAGARGDRFGQACYGGRGGAGGDGGSGGGGAGGISVGVLWGGDTMPTLDASTTDAITLGTPGIAGTGGVITNSAGEDGAEGFAEAVHQL